MRKVKQSEVVRSVFRGKKAAITSAVRRSVSPYGAARIISKELEVPFQVAYGVATLSSRSLRRLCNNS